MTEAERFDALIAGAKELEEELRATRLKVTILVDMLNSEAQTLQTTAMEQRHAAKHEKRSVRAVKYDSQPETAREPVDGERATPPRASAERSVSPQPKRKRAISRCSLCGEVGHRAANRWGIVCPNHKETK